MQILLYANPEKTPHCSTRRRPPLPSFPARIVLTLVMEPNYPPISVLVSSALSDIRLAVLFSSRSRYSVCRCSANASIVTRRAGARVASFSFKLRVIVQVHSCVHLVRGRLLGVCRILAADETGLAKILLERSGGFTRSCRIRGRVEVSSLERYLRKTARRSWACPKVFLSAIALSATVTYWLWGKAPRLNIIVGTTGRSIVGAELRWKNCRTSSAIPRARRKTGRPVGRRPRPLRRDAHCRRIAGH